LTQEKFPITWVVQAPHSAFYPGRHAGRIEINRHFPLGQPYIRWDMPIFSPFVTFGKSTDTENVSSPFELGCWSPACSLQHMLQTVASLIVFDPFNESRPERWPHGIPWKFHDLPVAANDQRYRDDIAKFRLVTRFFSRVYNSVESHRLDNPIIDSQQRGASIAAIKSRAGNRTYGSIEMESAPGQVWQLYPPEIDGRQVIGNMPALNGRYEGVIASRGK
jgi:hypothetical protein